ncbi:hypothetical protein EZS27_030713 [termite gut metagenome]|uniref:Transposase IS4-like domain-containing protein n=1 Tax=termite gut metagenome TaxID=433724 RepID=A0A5J4QC94_9ZZZZ
MFQDKYVFAQVVSFLNRSKFNRIVAKYDGDKYVKHFTCWNQLLALMFGQLSYRESLRDLIVALDAHHSKCYHLGMGKNVSKSSLARAHQDRSYHIFEEYAYCLVNEARQKRSTDIFNLGGNVYAFDSTTIDLCLAVFWWAKFRKKKGGIKVHTLYDVETQIPTFFHITNATIIHDSKAMKEIPYESGSYYIFDRAYNNFKMLYRIHQIGACFVVRAKKNLQCKSIKWKRRLPKNVLSDATIELIGFYPKQYYLERLRLVRYWDEEQEREFVFLTNAMHISALQVAELYKNRWQVELFFKWLKQHLKVKTFGGTTENAVRIQIYAAICTYCLVAIVQKDMKLDRSTYEVLQILSISLTDKTHLRDLFDKTKFQNDKERLRLNEPNLFDF